MTDKAKLLADLPKKSNSLALLLEHVFAKRDERINGWIASAHETPVSLGRMSGAAQAYEDVLEYVAKMAKDEKLEIASRLRSDIKEKKNG